MAEHALHALQTSYGSSTSGVKLELESEFESDFFFP